MSISEHSDALVIFGISGDLSHTGAQLLQRRIALLGDQPLRESVLVLTHSWLPALGALEPFGPLPGSHNTKGDGHLTVKSMSRF